MNSGRMKRPTNLSLALATVLWISLQQYIQSNPPAAELLVWGDISGYGWSRRNQRVDVPIPSLRDRQTYYGALDYLTKRFVVQEYNAGNEDNTVAFLKDLQSLLFRNAVHNGKQRFECCECGEQFVEQPQKKMIINSTRELINRLLQERISLAGIAVPLFQVKPEIRPFSHLAPTG